MATETELRTAYEAARTAGLWKNATFDAALRICEKHAAASGVSLLTAIGPDNNSQIEKNNG